MTNIAKVLMILRNLHGKNFQVSYLMAMEKSKCTPGNPTQRLENWKIENLSLFSAARASKKIVLPDPSVRLVVFARNIYVS